MRQPTNLRGATLPGLSQPSEKRRGHSTHLSDCRASSTRPTRSFVWSWRGPGVQTLKRAALSFLITWTAESQRSCEHPGVAANLPIHLCCKWVTAATKGNFGLEMLGSGFHRDEPDICTALCNMTACGSVGYINHSQMVTHRADWTWQQVTDLGVKYPPPPALLWFLMEIGTSLIRRYDMGGKLYLCRSDLGQLWFVGQIILNVQILHISSWPKMSKGQKLWWRKKKRSTQKLNWVKWTHNSNWRWPSDIVKNP